MPAIRNLRGVGWQFPTGAAPLRDERGTAYLQMHDAARAKHARHHQSFPGPPGPGTWALGLWVLISAPRIVRIVLLVLRRDHHRIGPIHAALEVRAGRVD